jgi:TetR/AcrR family transcriptional repressor of nem operon
MAKGDKKQETRQRIIDAAGRSFRSNGYAGIGVDGIAKAAGVTSGAFYAHLGSKNGAFDAAIKAGLDEVIEAIPIFQQENGGQWIKAFTNYYLGKAHRNDLECGCAMTSLSPEVVRTNAALQVIYEEKMLQIISLMADGFEIGSKSERVSRAWSVLAILIGGLTMARAVNSEKISNKIAKSIGNTAISVAGEISSKFAD